MANLRIIVALVAFAVAAIAESDGNGGVKSESTPLLSPTTSSSPVASPTTDPTPEPTLSLSPTASPSPVANPTTDPTTDPTSEPTPSQSPIASPSPVAGPTPEPTPEPTPSLSFSATLSPVPSPSSSPSSRTNAYGKLNRKFRGCHVNRPKFMGNGCPPGSFSHVNASDESTFTLSVMFSDFQVATNGSANYVFKRCAMKVQVDVEKGMSIGIAHIDFRGYSSVPDSLANGAYAGFKAGYAVADPERHRWNSSIFLDKKYGIGEDGLMYESAELSAVVWTPCRRNARSHTLLVQAKLTAFKSESDADSDDEVQVFLDSADSVVEKTKAPSAQPTSMQYRLLSRPCYP